MGAALSLAKDTKTLESDTRASVKWLRQTFPVDKVCVRLVVRKGLRMAFVECLLASHGNFREFVWWAMSIEQFRVRDLDFCKLRPVLSIMKDALPVAMLEAFT